MKVKWFLSILLPCLLLAGLAVGLIMAEEGAGGRKEPAAPPSSGGDGAAGEPRDARPAENEPTAVLKSLRIPGSALRPRASNVEYLSSISGGCLYASSGITHTVFNAPVFLPQDATVRAVRMYYHDTNEDIDSIGWFTVYDLYGNLVEEWGVSSQGSAGNGFNDTAIFTHTIDYSLHSYLVNWRPYVLGSEMQLCGFRIFYEGPYGFALPIISKNVSR
jgi:hypothetical protein